jgi:eukaryotic-like serine/threonine-protein kinase
LPASEWLLAGPPGPVNHIPIRLLIRKGWYLVITAIGNDDGSNEHIPGYRILGKLGRGWTTVVYKARQKLSGNMVAIKVLPEKLDPGSGFFRNFVGRATVASAVLHPNIIRTIDVGKSRDGFSYLVLEYVEGRTLFDLINPAPLGMGKHFSPKEAVNICTSIAEGLANAHSHGMVHGEVQPKNIIITASGIAKLANLGLLRPNEPFCAVTTERGKACGTPYYVAPEHIAGMQDIDARTDIYSLGATMHHLLAGRPPFDGPNVATVLNKHLTERCPPITQFNQAIDARVERIINIALSKNPEERYESMAAMLNDLRACAAM